MRVLFRSIVCLLAVFTAIASTPVGRSYPDQFALLEALGDGRVLGQVGVQFPARVIRIETGGTTAPGLPVDARNGADPALRSVYVEHAAGAGVLVFAAEV